MSLKRYYKVICVLILILTSSVNIHVFAQGSTFTTKSPGGGDWTQISSWKKTSSSTGTGNIKISKNSKNLTGISTLFSSELVVGSVIKSSSGTTIGTIASIASNTSATLVSNTASSYGGTSGLAFTIINTTDATSLPASQDDIVVSSGSTINVSTNINCNSISFLSTNSTNSIINIGNTGVLNVAKSITIARSTSGKNSISVGSGVLNVGGNIDFTNGGSTIRHEMTIGTGTVTVGGSLTANGCTGSASIVFSGAGYLNYGGTIFTTTGSNYGTITQYSLGSSNSTISHTIANAPSVINSIFDLSLNPIVANGSNTSLITVTLKDNNNVNLNTGGAKITFATLPTGFGIISSVTDNGNGTYTATYTAGIKSGEVVIQPKLSGTNFTNNLKLILIAGTAVKLAFTTQPSSSTPATIPFNQQPIVTIQDINGNTVLSDPDGSETITLSLTTGTGTLSGTTFIDASMGVADFSGMGLNINLGGVDKVITASASLNGTTRTVTSNVFTIGRTTPQVIPIISTYVYNGTPQGPNSATNTGSGSSYTYSYAGISPTVYSASSTLPTLVGSYNVTVTLAASSDGNYNSTSSSPTLFTIDAASSTITATGTTSFTYNSSPQGPSTSNVSGSTGSVSYSYSGTGSTSYSASSTKPTSAGTYQVIATVASDANYNSAVSSPLAFTISAPTSGLYFTQITPIPQTCYNLGSISLTVNGGTQPYKYDWIDISGTNNIQNRVGLVAGTYTITVTDALGTTATSSIVILDNATGCTGISVCKSEIASPFSVDPNPTITNYTWSVKDASNHAITNNHINGTGNAITIDWSSYAVGEYNVCAVTGNECTVNILPCQKVYVKQPEIAAFAEPSCDAGTLNLHAYGAANYSWSGPASFTSNSVDPILYNVGTSASGTYTLTATDANGCTATSTSVSVLVNPKPDISSATVSPTSSCNGAGTGFITLNTLSGANTPTYSWTKTGSIYTNTTKDISSLTSGSYSVNVTNAEGCSNTFTYFVSSSSGNNFSVTATAIDINCFGGTSSATATITGSPTGTPTFAWSNQSGTYTSTSSTFLNIPAGTYNVVATDDNTCSSASVVIIHQPLAPLTAEATLTNVDCKGGTTGAITINAKGGTPSYTYSWVGPVGFNNPGNNSVASGLIAGTYTITITDAGGGACSYTNSYTIIEPSGVLSSTATVTAINCFGSSTGIVNLTTEGGTSPYSYSWSKSAGVAAGSYSATTSSISWISAGSYSVTITDNKGCTLTPTSIIVSEPSATLNFAATTPTNVNCYGGSTGAITLTAQGGTSSYTYSWSNGSTSNALTNLSAGTYTATVTDNNGCTYSQGYTITQPISSLTASATASSTTCFGGANGSVNLTVSGGTTAYTYAWTKVGAGSYNASTEDINSLTAGTYNVTVTDHNSCTTTASAVIAEPTLLSLSASVTNVLCNAATTGEINITAAGGTGAYTYNWGSSVNAEDRTSLAAGTYSVTVTDANSCTVNGSYTITQPSAISLSLTNTNLSCNASADGAINLTATGGAGSFTYAWSGPNTFNSTSKNISGLSIGIYVVTVTDASGCSATHTSTAITEPTVLTLTIPSSTDINCFNGSTGAATALAAGGTGGTIGSGYSYSWTDGTIGASLANVKAGNYSVTATDANGCATTTGINLTQPAKAMALYASATDTRACAGTPSGKIDLVVENTTGTLTYVWTGPTSIGNVQSPSNLAAGNYSVVVNSSLGCSATIAATVGTSAALSVNVDGFSRTCATKPDGSAYAVVTGGVAPYTYLWSNTATSQSISSLTTDTYSVNVTDANGCSSSASTTLTAPNCDVPIAVTDVFVSANGATISNTIATNDIDNAYAKTDLQFQLLSSPATTQGTIQASLTGDFTFTPAADFNGAVEIPYMVSNPLGLSDRSTLNIFVSNMTVNANVVDASCDTGGSITLSIAGGFPYYTYAWTGPSSFASTQKDLTGLTPGTYNLVITDTKGATVSRSFIIAEGCIPPPGASTVYISGKNAFTYNGGSQGPTTTTKHGSTGAITIVYIGTGSTNYPSSATAPTNIGTYKAIATLDADPNFTGATSNDFAFTIDKLLSTIEVTGLTSYTYNTLRQGPITSNVTGSTATPTYSYLGTGATTYGPSATLPTLVGSYEVVANVDADDTHTSASSRSYTFSIQKANTTIQVNGSNTYSYTGSGLGPIATSVSGSTATPTFSYYGVGTTQYAPSASLPVDIGSYEVVASVDADNNYNSASSSPFAFTILDASTPAVISINRVEATPTNLSTLHFVVTFSKDITGFDAGDLTAVYTGTVSSTGVAVSAISASAYTVTFTGLSGNGTLGLNLKSSGTGITDLHSNALINGYTGQVYSIDKITNAPTLTTPSSNSSASGQNLDISINIPEVNLPNTITLTFQSVSNTILLVLNNASGNITGSLNTNNLSASSIVASSSQATLPAGVYSVTLRYQDYLGNPVASASISNFSFNIGLNSTIVVTGLTTYTYNGTAQGPITSTVTGSTSTPTYSYSGTGSTTYGPSATPPTGPGTYSVVATVATDANYIGETSAPYAFTINKATSTIVVTGSTTYTFSGNAQGPITSTVTGSTATPVYSYVGTGTTTYGPSATRPSLNGSYEVVASVVGDDNFNGASSVPFAFTISEYRSSVVITGDNIFTYNEIAQGPTATTVTGSNGAVTILYSGIGSTTYTSTSTLPTAPGTYKAIATVAASGSYTSAISAEFNFTINKAASAITVTGLTTFNYNATAQGPSTSTVTGSTGAVTYTYRGTGGTTYSSTTAPTAPGTYEVIATVAGDANYNAATSAPYVFVVNAVLPQASINLVDKDLLNTDIAQLDFEFTNGTAPFTAIVSNNKSSTLLTLSNLTSGVKNDIGVYTENTIFKIEKLTDALGIERTTGFTKDTALLTILKPLLLLTLKAEPAVIQTDKSFKTQLSLKVKNAGALNLANVQVNANLSNVFPSNINYKLDSIKVVKGNLRLNPTYQGNGVVNTPFSIPPSNKFIAYNGIKSNALLDPNFLFSNGVNLAINEEGEVIYYISIAPTVSNITLELQFNSSASGLLEKTDGTISTQTSQSSSQDGAAIDQHPDLTGVGTPAPTYLPLFSKVSIGGSLKASAATKVAGGYIFHMTSKVVNYGNENVDSVLLMNNFATSFPSPDTAYIINTPQTLGPIKLNNNFDGYHDKNLLNYIASVLVGDSIMIDYDLFIGSTKTKNTWTNSFNVSGVSSVSATYIRDISTNGLNPDPNADENPIESELTKLYVSYTEPLPPVVVNGNYIYNSPSIPTNLSSLVKSYPTGTIPVWCDVATSVCSPTAPLMPTLIGKYIYQVRSYDTASLLYSLNYVNDTVTIRPPVPTVVDSTYIIGLNTNPANVAVQVKGMSGSVLNYYINAAYQNTVPKLGSVTGVYHYTTSQTVNSISSDTIGFKVTMIDVNDVIHLQKVVDTAILKSNSTFDYKFSFVVTNLSKYPFTNLVISDNLQNSVPLTSNYNVLSNTATTPLIANSMFNGNSDFVVASASSLAANDSSKASFIMNLAPNGYNGTLSNIATVSANTIWGRVNMVSSNASRLNETSKQATNYYVEDLLVNIPEGFSPNRDGVNDYFVIIRPANLTIDLQVFNRWGNIVYENKNYNNEFDGKGTGNFLGKDLVEGGYYYVVNAIDQNGKKQEFKGYIIIQR